MFNSNPKVPVNNPKGNNLRGYTLNSHRRQLLGGLAAVPLLTACSKVPAGPKVASSADTSTRLQSMAENAVPISVDERKARIAKAQKLMQEKGIGALLIEAGSALVYFTGIRWWRSERFTGAIIPAEGDFIIVTPFFEEPSIAEQMTFGDDIRTWHEDESPYKIVTDFLSEKGATDKSLAIEETVRHFIPDGISQERGTPRKIISGKSVTRGVRMFKSPAELALMQTANDITMAAYLHVYPKVNVGMSSGDISDMMNAATTQLGGKVKFSMALNGTASAYPHGTKNNPDVKEGDIILMDCGCDVLDYESDISRTWVIGEPSAKQRTVWDMVKRGQELALETARVGTPAGMVDATVREMYAAEGWGPDYAAPGLTHRLGHGIGLDGHEPINFVRSETTRLAPGMCFSNEPGIYIPGEFGVRLEDCLYMTEAGPKLFSPLSKSIDDPFG